MQEELFAQALFELQGLENLINQVIEVTLSDDHSGIEVIRYAMPRS